MGLDIRLPLGLVFLITGLILLIYGIVTYGSPIYVIALGFNLNLICGLIMAAFGVTMVLFGQRSQR